MHKISIPQAYRAVYKALHGVFTGLSLVTLGEIQKKEYSGGRLRYLDAAIEAAKRFWMGPPGPKFYASLGLTGERIALLRVT